METTKMKKILTKTSSQSNIDLKKAVIDKSADLIQTRKNWGSGTQKGNNSSNLTNKS